MVGDKEILSHRPDCSEVVVDELQKMLEDAVRNAGASASDRRRESRTQIARPVYIRPADPSETPFEEVQVTTDFSNAGLHFVTAQRDCYRKGMQLYLIPALGCLNFECLGEVVRMEPLPEGRCGIAVKLLRIGKPIVDDRTVKTSAFRSRSVLRLAETWVEVSPTAAPGKSSRDSAEDSRAETRVAVKESSR